MPTTLFLLLLTRFASASADPEDSGLLTDISAVEQETVNLPCDVTPPVADDELRLVLWYYGTEGTPMYTYDARGRQAGAGAHWTAPAVAAGRLRFEADRRPAALVIRRLRPADQRLYRCRVDFLHSPTRNSRVNLTVITPPSRPTIHDSSGRLIQDITWRRYREGERVRLTCTATGGSPPPNVTWWRDSELLESSSHVTVPSGAVQSHVTVGPLSRDQLGQRYTCSATNHVRAPPRSTSVGIDMLLGPLSVRLLGANSPLSAGVMYQLSCQSVGSRPAAVITWWKDSHQLTAVDETLSHDGNVTTSRLRFRPGREDAGRQIRCRAQNPLLSAIIEDAWALTIRFAPEVSVKSWSSPPDAPLAEGHDVYLQCRMTAEPAPLRLVWKRNGVPLVGDRRGDVVITNDTLVLHQVTSEASGDYTCSAFNDEGSGTSPAVKLRVRYAPRCAPGQVTRYGASRGQTIYIRCRVTAEPAPRRFFWAFNNSGHLIDVPESHTESTGGESLCRYTPRSDLDFGLLLCWAENAVAAQRKPCAFRIVLTERPEGLVNCSITNTSSDSLRVHCTPGYDGGVRQTFVLELTDTETGRVVTNITSDVPRFAAQGLSPGRRYLVTAYAQNSQGRGHQYQAAAVTAVDQAQRSTSSEHSPEPADDATVMTPLLLGSLLGVVAVLVALLLALLIGGRLRGQRCLKRRNRQTTSSADINNQIPLNLHRKASYDSIPLEGRDPEEKQLMIGLRPVPVGQLAAGRHHHPPTDCPRSQADNTITSTTATPAADSTSLQPTPHLQHPISAPWLTHWPPNQRPTDGPTAGPTEEPMEEPTEEPGEEPVEGRTEGPTEGLTEETTEEPTEESTEGWKEGSKDGPIKQDGLQCLETEPFLNKRRHLESSV